MIGLLVWREVAILEVPLNLKLSSIEWAGSDPYLRMTKGGSSWYRRQGREWKLNQTLTNVWELYQSVISYSAGSTLSPTPLFKKLIPLMGLPNSDRVKSWKQRKSCLGAIFNANNRNEIVNRAFTLLKRHFYNSSRYLVPRTTYYVVISKLM